MSMELYEKCIFCKEKNEWLGNLGLYWCNKCYKTLRPKKLHCGSCEAMSSGVFHGCIEHMLDKETKKKYYCEATGNMTKLETLYEHLKWKERWGDKA